MKEKYTLPLNKGYLHEIDYSWSITYDYNTFCKIIG